MATVNGSSAVSVSGQAYTQTYVTASRTHANLTAADLTDNTGVTPDATIESVPAVGAADVDVTAAALDDTNASLTALENNVADLRAQCDALLVDLTNVKQVLTGLIDDLQTSGVIT